MKGQTDGLMTDEQSDRYRVRERAEIASPRLSPQKGTKNLKIYSNLFLLGRTDGQIDG